MIGDIVGSAGRRILKQTLPGLKRQYQTDLCLANAENAAAGLGLTATLARDILACGVDLLTLGNHSWARTELLASIERIDRLIRPANGPAAWPGRDHALLEHPAGNVLIVNLLGRIFMDPVDDPFTTADRLLESLKTKYQTKMVVIDFHAEATSEKNALAHYLDGRISLLAGTHTHVQTADERILPRGTAVISDVGMTGPSGGVIGMDPASSLRRFVDHLPARYETADGPAMLNAISVLIDPASGQTRQIERIQVRE
jgi:hypothetical protein